MATGLSESVETPKTPRISLSEDGHANSKVHSSRDLSTLPQRRLRDARRNRLRPAALGSRILEVSMKLSPVPALPCLRIYLSPREKIEKLTWLFHHRRAGATGDISIDASGTFVQVAGGSGWQFGDSPAPFCNDPSGTCLNATGGSDYGYTWFTNGANHWHNEYYWLDGQVTLQTSEGTGLYNVAANVTSKSIFSTSTLRSSPLPMIR